MQEDCPLGRKDTATIQVEENITKVKIHIRSFDRKFKEEIVDKV